MKYSEKVFHLLEQNEVHRLPDTELLLLIWNVANSRQRYTLTNRPNPVSTFRSNYNCGRLIGGRPRVHSFQYLDGVAIGTHRHPLTIARQRELCLLHKIYDERFLEQPTCPQSTDQ